MHYRVKTIIATVVAIYYLLSLSALSTSAQAYGELGVTNTAFSYHADAALKGKPALFPSKNTIKSPNATWSCFTTTFAGKVGALTMWGEGYINCSQNMATIDMTEYAMYCQPVLWGCLWFNQGQMGPGCTYHNLSAQYCPSSGTYRWSKNIDPGELWGVQTYVCAYAYDGSSTCGGTMQEVQF